MTVLTWDQEGEKYFETGVSKAVLYVPDATGAYTPGIAWNGVTAFNEAPSGAEPSKNYADNIVYGTLMSLEEYGFSIEAFQSPSEFDVCDGMAEPVVGLSLGQQTRKKFGFCVRTEIGNDEDQRLGYKLHLIYNCLASPSSHDRSTINDNPEMDQLSWEVSTTAVAVTGYQPTSKLTIDSRTANATKLAALEAVLYGSTESPARLPLPAEIVTLLTPAAG